MYAAADEGISYLEKNRFNVNSVLAATIKRYCRELALRYQQLSQKASPSVDGKPGRPVQPPTQKSLPQQRNASKRAVSPSNHPNRCPPPLPPRQEGHTAGVHQGDSPAQPALSEPKFQFSHASVNYDPNDPYEKTVVENVLDSSPSVKWEDIAGVDYAKEVLYETVILPSKRPDLFTGLRAPPKGILLFGPPGTGKTMLAKAVATESSAVFFSISSSSLTSKWVGESEKIVRALFKVAYKNQPSIVFIDEIDSVLTARSDNENEASRRLKTEFMIQLDGAATSGEERVLIMGATNRPFELDDAVIRRMARRIYIPLPDEVTRYELFKIMLKDQSVSLSKEDVKEVLRRSELYSGSDIKVLCKEAAMGPIREVTDLLDISASKIRPIQLKDFVAAFRTCSPSVSPSTLTKLEQWNEQFGSKGEGEEKKQHPAVKSIKQSAAKRR
ncbi:hypothetical protein WA556_002393 [Blastocystis sp. ATCC 50177/Nand II]